MAGALRKTMVYLGLAEEDGRYEVYDGEAADVDFPVGDDDETSYVAAVPEEPDEPDLHEERRAAVTPISRGHVARMVPAPAAELHRISTIHPRTYNDAKTIGESFRGGTPVIMNLTDLDDADAKRLVDFAAGLVFGLHGSIEKVTSKVFLLSPANVEVAPAGKPRTAPERALFNQS